MDLSSDTETMNLLSLDTATDLTVSMKEDEWRGRRKERKNDGTLMCICKVVQLLLGVHIEHLDGLVIRPRNDESVVARHCN